MIKKNMQVASVVVFQFMHSCMHGLKLFPVVGSWFSFFGVNSAWLPIMGAFVSSESLMASWAVHLLIRMAIFGLPSLASLAFIVPGITSSWYLATKSRQMSIGVALVCMLAFWVHPVGAQAWSYALYWLIPVAIAWYAPTYQWLHCIAASFIAHAVGSVIWLYTVEMTVGQWMGLMPYVAVERLYIAGLMYGFYVAVNQVLSLVTSVRLRIQCA